MEALSARKPQPLRGIRVLDFSHVIAGPFATFYLAQLGADVTKVEKPGGGDVMRRTASGARAFTALNAGKRTREIDIATANRLRDALLEAISADPTPVVDMAGVTFVDASGIRAILEVSRSLNGRGPLLITHAALMQRLLELVGLDVPSVVFPDGA